MKTAHSLIAFLLAIVLSALCSCSGGGGSPDAAEPETAADEAKPDAHAGSGENGDIMIRIEMENGGVIRLELYPDKAPITVENFVSLAKDGFYDGLIFHRVIKGFMIQGGDPEGTGTGGAKNKIKGEFKANGVDNDISHVRGVISMARAKAYDSASSQFFIVHQDSTYLDGNYAAFGRVVEGMDVVDEIASVPTDYRDRPLEDVVIKTITVEEPEAK